MTRFLKTGLSVKEREMMPPLNIVYIVNIYNYMYSSLSLSVLFVWALGDVSEESSCQLNTELGSVSVQHIGRVDYGLPQ